MGNVTGDVPLLDPGRPPRPPIEHGTVLTGLEPEHVAVLTFGVGAQQKGDLPRPLLPRQIRTDAAAFRQRRCQHL